MEECRRGEERSGEGGRWERESAGRGLERSRERREERWGREGREGVGMGWQGDGGDGGIRMEWKGSAATREGRGDPEGNAVIWWDRERGKEGE